MHEEIVEIVRSPSSAIQQQAPQAAPKSGVQMLQSKAPQLRASRVEREAESSSQGTADPGHTRQALGPGKVHTLGELISAGNGVE